MKNKTRADHYDDYENIILTEGQFGFCAATLWNSGQEGVLCYRDCEIEDELKEITLHLMSEAGGSVEVVINGKTVGNWQGDTRTYEANPRPIMGPMMIKDAKERINTWKPVYADVKIPLAYDAKADQEKPVELEIRLSGDIKLCYFKA